MERKRQSNEGGGMVQGSNPRSAKLLFVSHKSWSFLLNLSLSSGKFFRENRKAPKMNWIRTVTTLCSIFSQLLQIPLLCNALKCHNRGF